MNKKVIAGLLAFTFMFGGMSALTAGAESFEIEDNAVCAEYTESADNEVCAANSENDFSWKDIDVSHIMLTGYNGTAKDVVIPSKVKNKTVSEIGAEAFKEKNQDDFNFTD